MGAGIARAAAERRFKRLQPAGVYAESRAQSLARKTFGRVAVQTETGADGIEQAVRAAEYAGGRRKVGDRA